MGVKARVDVKRGVKLGRGVGVAVLVREGVGVSGVTGVAVRLAVALSVGRAVLVSPLVGERVSVVRLTWACGVVVLILVGLRGKGVRVGGWMVGLASGRGAVGGSRGMPFSWLINGWP